MATKKETTVDAVIDEVVAEEENELGKIKSTLAKAQQAMEKARVTMSETYGKTRQKSHEAAERVGIYMEDAKRHLADAKMKMSELAAATREKAEVLYNKTREQYEQLAAKSRDLYGRMRDRIREVDFKEKGDQVLEYIKDNPGKAVMIALATGFLVGYVTRPKD